MSSCSCTVKLHHLFNFEMCYDICSLHNLDCFLHPTYALPHHHRDSFSPVPGEAALGGSRSPLLARGPTLPSRPGDKAEKRLTDSSAMMDNEADRNLGMTLDAFASSLAEEEAARPAMLQPLRGKPPLPPLPSLERDPTGALNGNAPAAVWKDASGDGLMFEVEMWRSDLLTSVLEMDKSGNLVGGGLANPLCPPSE